MRELLQATWNTFVLLVKPWMRTRLADEMGYLADRWNGLAGAGMVLVGAGGCRCRDCRRLVRLARAETWAVA